MSKFKNKKALALSVGAIMAGVSVIGVVAACAPTKAKPNKPSQGTQNPSQSGGTESTNPGSGNTTNPSGQGSGTGGTTNANPGSGSTTSPDKQGSENNTTNPSAGSTNTNPQTSPKDGAGSSNTGKDTTKQENKKMQDDQPGTNGGTTEKPKDGQSSETTDKPKVGSGESNTETGKNEQPKEGSGSENNKKPNENAGGTNDQNPSEDNKVEPSNPGSAEKPNMEADSSKENGDSSNGQNEGKKESEVPEKPNTNGSTPEASETVKPVTASLEDKVKLNENNGDFNLALKFQNANGKFVEVELTDAENASTIIKSNQKVEVTNDQAVVAFGDVKLTSKYKIKSIKLFDKIDATDGKALELQPELTNKVIDLDTKILELVEFKREQEGFPYISLKVSTKLYPQLDNKVFGFKIENRTQEGISKTYFATVLGKKIYTREIGKSGGKTTFLIFTDQKYQNDPANGNYYISKLWLDEDPKQNDLLKARIDFTS